MKPFDLAAAQRGEKVQFHKGEFPDSWQDMHFIGVALSGRLVVQELADHREIRHVLPSSLRMAPKPPKEMWVQLYTHVHIAIGCTHPHESPEAARGAMASHCTRIGEPQKVLVPDES